VSPVKYGLSFYTPVDGILHSVMLGFVCSVPDCWLEVNLHPEGPATDQLDQGFFALFLGPRANAELVPKCHVALDV
jgi:hypothetical protein